MTGWATKPLGEIAENLDSKRVPITKSKRESGDVPYYGASGVVDHVKDYLFDEPLLLVSEDGANLLARTYPIAFSVSGKTWVNNHAHVLRFGEAVTRRFVELYLNSISLEPYVSGMAQPKLNQKKLSGILVPLPPLEEQQRIVAVLDEAFEGLARARAHAEANLQNARDILESQLASQFLVGSPDWVEKKMGDICSLITDGKHGDCENQDDSGYYFLSAKDVKNGTLNYDGSRQITFADFQETHRRTDLSAGDVLVTNAGTIGRTAIAQDDPKTERTTFQKSVAVLKPKREVIDSNFLELGLRANLVNLQKLSAGAAQKNLLLRDLRSFFVRMPERIEEQMRVAEEFAKLQVKVELLENKALSKLQDLDDLRQSLLQKAFAGELT